MKALLLNGERKGEDSLGPAQEALVRELLGGGWRTEVVALRDVSIAPCTGCFGCWVRTPGVCVIPDFGRDLVEKVVGSDLMVFLTPVTFGGYSPELKKAVDRFSCPLLLPFFTKIHGTVRHRPRYKPLPRLIGLGVLPRPDQESKEIFEGLIAANAANLHSPAQAAAVVYDSRDPGLIREEVRTVIREVYA